MFKKLTEANVLTLSTRDPDNPDARIIRYWDTHADAPRRFCVVVQCKTGVRSYVVHWRFPRSTIEHTKVLGRVGEVTLQEARDKARAARAMLNKGMSPRTIDPTNSDLFKSCVETWTKQQLAGKNRTQRVVTSAGVTERWMLNRFKGWHTRPIGTLTRAEIEEELDKIRDGSKRWRPSASGANRLHSHLTTFFNWCVTTGKLGSNPLLGTFKPAASIKRRERDWFEGKRSDVAIAKIWKFADELGGNHGRFIQLLMVLGKRRSVVQHMDWSEIDSWYWTPPKGSHNKRNHPIPLPRLAKRLLGTPRDKGRVFEPIEEQQLARRVREATGITDFLWHGLRHVAETKLAELGVQPHVRDLCFDHLPDRGNGAVYDHHSYKQEKLAALELWGSHIEAVVKGKPQWHANLQARLTRLAKA